MIQSLTNKFSSINHNIALGAVAAYLLPFSLPYLIAPSFSLSLFGADQNSFTKLEILLSQYLGCFIAAIAFSALFLMKLDNRSITNINLKRRVNAVMAVSFLILSMLNNRCYWEKCVAQGNGYLFAFKTVACVAISGLNAMAFTNGPGVITTTDKKTDEISGVDSTTTVINKSGSSA